MLPGNSFSTPKGIPLVSTPEEIKANFIALLKVSVPRRAFLWFPHNAVIMRRKDMVGPTGPGFSTPKGIPLVSTRKFLLATHNSLTLVSVPRRAFLWFPPMRSRQWPSSSRRLFQYPEGHSSGFHVIGVRKVSSSVSPMFQYPEGHSSGFHFVLAIIAIAAMIWVSVPRRAFLWFPRDAVIYEHNDRLLFQYPEGHSSGFHKS